MKPPAFDYLRAESLDEALLALGAHGDNARVLAGGQSLVPMLNMRLVAPEVLVDIGQIEALDRIERRDGKLVVGAGTRQGSLAAWPGLLDFAPLLAEALPFVGHYQTRAQGTVCGSIAHADPSSELALCLATLGGEVRLRSARGERTLPARDFQEGMLSTAIGEDELIESVAFPERAPDTAYAFAEFAMRHGDFAIVAIAAAVDGEGIRLGVGGATDKPVVTDLPLLEGEPLDDALVRHAADLPLASDPHATPALRARLVRTLGREAIEKARRARSYAVSAT